MGRIVRRSKSLQWRWYIWMMRERMMIHNWWHWKGISCVASERVILACWRVMVIPHRRAVWVIIWRNWIVAGIAVCSWCWRQLHEGRLARNWMIKVVGLVAEVHLVVRFEDQTIITALCLQMWQWRGPRFEWLRCAKQQTQWPRVVWLICMFE